jgi:hypothetical protein
VGLNLVPVDVPAGLNSDDTAYAASPAWADGSNVRFRLGRPQVIGGWESLTLSLLSGVCRTVFGWTENNTNVLDVAFGEHDRLQLTQSGTLYDITPTLALPAATLGAPPFATVNASATVTVTHAGHPYVTGDVLVISGAVDTNGILAANLNGSRSITVTGVNAYTFAAGAAATGTGMGGGSAVVVTPQRAWSGGAIDGAGSAGYGTGSYGGGVYGQASPGNFFAMTWSLAAWGQRLIACPRGQTIHLWANDTAARAQPIQNAPAQVTYALVTPQRQIFALGCNQELDGVFNPLCIRHSGAAAETTWSTIASDSSTAREYVLADGGRIVAGRVVGRYVLIWTNHNLWLGTYYGQLQKVWGFDKVGDKCGLIGPNAAVVVGSTAYWISPDRQFHSYTWAARCSRSRARSARISPTTCRPRNGTRSSPPRSASSTRSASTIPTRAMASRTAATSPSASTGLTSGPGIAAQMARTAMVDAGPHAYPIGVTFDGHVYWHEKGASADGAALGWSLSTANLYLDENRSMLTRKFFPDTGGQVGAITLTITTTMAPNDRDPRSFGPYLIAADQQEIDIMPEGRLFQLDFSGSSAPAFMRLGRLLFDAKPRGRR